jgi:predicted transcriptional regulator
MSVLELKTRFHELIDRIDDEKQLAALYGLVAEQAIETDETHQLSEEDVARIKSSLAQIERGQTISNEVVMEHLREWLSK